MSRLVKIFYLMLLIFSASQAAFSAPVEVIRNGNFGDDYSQWIVHHQLGGWKPSIQMRTIGSETNDPCLDMSMLNEDYIGAALFQNLNVTNCAGKTFSFSMQLMQSDYWFSGIQIQLDYVDISNKLHSMDILNVLGDPNNLDAWTPYAAQLTLPSDARKIVRLAIVHPKYSYQINYRIDDLSLTAEDVTVGQVPVVTSIDKKKGAYGTDITISGSGFGTSGEVTSWPHCDTAKIKSWSDGTIVATIDEPFKTGWIRVSSDFTEAAEEHYFHVTSPYFMVRTFYPSARVVKGQTAEFIIDVFAFNGFTSETGATVSVTDAPAGVATVIPSKVKIPGATLIKVNTSSLSPGNHTFHVKVAVPGCQDQIKTISLNVVTITDITFEDVGSMQIVTTLEAFHQWPMGMVIQGTGSDGVLVSPDNFSIVSSDPSVVACMGIDSRHAYSWEYEICPLKTGTADIVVTTPDGYSKTLPVSVDLTGEITIDDFTITPNVLTNAGNQTFTAKATGPFPLDVDFDYQYKADCALVATDSQGDDFTYSCEGTATVGSKADPGTYWISANFERGDTYPSGMPWANPVASLTIVNDPSLGEITGSIYAPGPSKYSQRFGYIHVCDADGTVVYQKVIDGYYEHSDNYRVSGIKPGTYYVRYRTDTYTSGPYEQWYYGGPSVKDAIPVTVTAGQTVADINFYILSGGPYVNNCTPSNGCQWVSTDSDVQYAYFYADPRTVPYAFERVEDENHNVVEGTLTVDEEGAVTFHPTAPLAPGMTYTVFINSATMDYDGYQHADDFSWSFTTTDSNNIGDLLKLSTFEENIKLTGKILHYVYSTRGYIEDSNRASGIMIGSDEPLSNWVTANSLVDIFGDYYPAYDYGDGRRNDPYIRIRRPEECKNLGPASVRAFGATNIAAKQPLMAGLRTTVWGRVIPGSINLRQHSYRITDGSDLNGIKIIDEFAVPTVTDNEFVIVTGACGQYINERTIYKF